MTERVDHFMWPVFRHGFEDAHCSCGFEQHGSMWLDDVMLTDIFLSGAHPDAYLIAYPDEEYPQTTGGIKRVRGGLEVDLSRDEIQALLSQPDLPDEFRRAAAVHLEDPPRT